MHVGDMNAVSYVWKSAVAKPGGTVRVPSQS